MATRKIASILLGRNKQLTTLTCGLRSLRSLTSDLCHLRVEKEPKDHRRSYTEKVLGRSLELYGDTTMIDFKETLRLRLS
jgi:hypothetical protein